MKSIHSLLARGARAAITMNFIISTVAANQLQDILLPPKADPNPLAGTNDPQDCLDYNLTFFFDPPEPKPDGPLHSALSSFGDELLGEVCPDPDEVDCPYPDLSSWCRFSTEAAAATEGPSTATVLEEFSSYVRGAYEWVAEHSEAAVELAQSCPGEWEFARGRVFLGDYALNQTLIWAQCWADSHQSTATVEDEGPEETGSSSSGSSAAPGSKTVAGGPEETEGQRTGGAANLRSRRAIGIAVFVALVSLVWSF